MANKKTALKRAKKEAMRRAAALGAEFITQELRRESDTRIALPPIPVDPIEDLPVKKAV